MSYPYNFHPIAEEELFEAIDYLDKKREGYGSLIAGVAAEVFDQITSNPKRFPLALKDSNIRRAILSKPFHKSYSVYFHFDGEKVIIISFFNNSRDPEEWQNR